MLIGESDWGCGIVVDVRYLRVKFSDLPCGELFMLIGEEGVFIKDRVCLYRALQGDLFIRVVSRLWKAEVVWLVDVDKSLFEI